MAWSAEVGNPKIIIVPHNERALQLLHIGKDDYNITSFFELTKSEYKSLFDLFEKFNDEFMLMIGDFEGDDITACNADRALEIIHTFVPENDSEEYQTGIAKVTQALECAKQHGTMAMFEF